ncbi:MULTISPECIES: endonuclease III [unclassified Adlercreutzia]|uniref:endonuclease III n=1 Tax=unclassified Adlercreutzia TaxID=2636013 RepID=UPI0013EB9DAC|nr:MULTISPECIES: endonuclease III [unclassified Adlercreutzia]
MPRETMTAKRERAASIERALFDHYGEGACSLDYLTPFQLTVAVVLSAQCTDAAVNKVTPALFARYPTPAAMAGANVADVEEIIHSLGFFRSKAKNLVALAQTLLTTFGGEVPNDVDALQKLPGVGRKTANVVMCEAFRNPQGIAVDTHVFRIAHRLGFATRNDDTPAKTEAKLLKIYPQPDWLYINHQWVHFGREFCRARNPRCADCIIGELCPSRGKA